MASVAVSILATTPEDYARDVEQVQGFARRLHVDISNGDLAETRTINVARVYVPDNLELELHMMVRYPAAQLQTIMSLNPRLVIVHFEAHDKVEDVLSQLREVGIRVGVAILPDTKVEQVSSLLTQIDHLLVFTGHFGHYGGTFNGACLDKISQAKAINPQLEVSVDGGINPASAQLAIQAGADELITGSYIHTARDPQVAYQELVHIAGGIA